MQPLLRAGGRDERRRWSRGRFRACSAPGSPVPRRPPASPKAPMATVAVCGATAESRPPEFPMPPAVEEVSVAHFNPPASPKPTTNLERLTAPRLLTAPKPQTETGRSGLARRQAFYFGGQARLVSCGLVSMHDALARHLVDHGNGCFQRIRCRGMVTGIHGSLHLLDVGAHHGTLTSVASPAAFGLPGAFSCLSTICHAIFLVAGFNKGRVLCVA